MCTPTISIYVILKLGECFRQTIYQEVTSIQSLKGEIINNLTGNKIIFWTVTNLRPFVDLNGHTAIIVYLSLSNTNDHRSNLWFSHFLFKWLSTAVSSVMQETKLVCFYNPTSKYLPPVVPVVHKLN